MSRRHTATGSLATHTRRTTTTVAITHQEINLAGSTGVASDYFHYAINCVLYQREIYDQAFFKMDKTFRLQMMIVEHEAIAEALQKIFDHVRGCRNLNLSMRVLSSRPSINKLSKQESLMMNNPDRQDHQTDEQGLQL
ncbi:hypothetical protein O181_123574 [Austropuccinia psidii MF-1]|uniref:HORMA domain-containing protein n=1 Tax=Austropuccinia psidii MF-1 TaxID=1389203 RepID=A0A9Q3KMQ3_9BASI|nr:hypothetical protein [Austropuccinia psidii MF-1]